MFGQMMQPQQGLEQQGVPETPTSLAGLLIMSGVTPQDAYVQGAQMFREQEHARIEQYKQQQKQNERMQFTQLADYLKQNPTASNQELAAAGLQMGVNPANLPAFLGALGTEEKIIEDKLRGQGPQIFTKKAGVYSRNPPISNPMTPNASQFEPRLAPEEMSEIEALNIAKTPVKPTTPKMKASTDEFVSFADNFRPNSTETPTLKTKEIDQKNYHKFKETSIEPILKASEELDTHLGEITDASKKFKTGFAADKRLAAQKLGNYLGIDNAEEVAAGELIEKASAKMVLDFAKLMKGVVSDKDIAFLQKMVPTLMASPEGNKQIIKYFKRLNTHNRKYANAASRYYSDRKHINDFAEIYDEYTQSTPIFAEEIEGVAAQGLTPKAIKHDYDAIRRARDRKLKEQQR